MAQLATAPARGRSASPAAGAGRRVDLSAADIAALPRPVQRYLRGVLQDGAPIATRARIAWEGSFRLIDEARTDATWHPFDAAQVFTTTPPGFVWDARMRMAPLIDVRVRDSYVAGRGGMAAAVLGALNIVDAGGAHELDEGALQRFLGECVWMPTALLPHDGLEWAPMDDAHARATLTDGGASVSLEFEFAPSGEIVAVFTPHRYRSRDRGFVGTPFGGTYGAYERHGGMRVPMESEVYWVLNGHRVPYWRGRVRSIAFEPHQHVPDSEARAEQTSSS